MMFSHNEPAGNFEVLGPWGSVPARTDVKAGTAGSYEFVVQTLGLECLGDAVIFGPYDKVIRTDVENIHF